MELMARSDMKRRPNIRRKPADFGLPQDFERMTMILSLRKESDRERRVGRMIGHHIETDDATFAAFERDLIIDRVRSAIEGGKKRGKFCSGVPMLGYRSDPFTKKLLIDEEEAETVRLIF